MNDENVIKHSDQIIRMSLSPEETEALDNYLAKNALKKGPWLKLLMIQELQAKQFLQRPDYKPPTTESAMIKGSRK